MSKTKKIDKYKRKTVFAELEQFDYMSKENDFIEITKWTNGEGFDIEINSSNQQVFQLTFGQFDAIKSLLNELENHEWIN